MLFRSHYVTRRNDSPFWKEFKEKTEVPPVLVDVFERHKYIPLHEDSHVRRNEMFTAPNWMILFEALGLTNKNVYNTKFDVLNIEDEVKPHHKLMTVSEFLKIVPQIHHPLDFTIKEIPGFTT